MENKNNQTKQAFNKLVAKISNAKFENENQCKQTLQRFRFVFNKFTLPEKMQILSKLPQIPKGVEMMEILLGRKIDVIVEYFAPFAVCKDLAINIFDDETETTGDFEEEFEDEE